MDKELTRELIASGSAALQGFAQTAKVTAEHLYGVLVRQQIIEGITTLISTVVFVAVMVVMVKKLLAWAKRKAEKNKYDREVYYFIAAVSIVAVGLTTLLVSAALESAIGHILNPEYYALEFIFNTVNKR